MNNMLYCILTVPTRLTQAQQLQQLLPASVLFVDEQMRGAAFNHLRALEYALSTGYAHVLIMEDDAQPVDNFVEHVENWADRYPDELISFYLGTSRPPQYQAEVTQKIAQRTSDYITMNQLIHGVCYMLPVSHISNILQQCCNSNQPADFRIGTAWMLTTRKQIIYTYPSYVEHADEQPTEKHPDGEKRTEPRKARALYIERNK